MKTVFSTCFEVKARNKHFSIPEYQRISFGQLYTSSIRNDVNCRFFTVSYIHFHESGLTLIKTEPMELILKDFLVTNKLRRKFCHSD